MPEVLRRENPVSAMPNEIPIERYTSRAFFDLEVEKVWKRVWQMACREEDIPNVGDNIVYDIAGMSFVVLRTRPDTIKAYVNACLHRGRLLREQGGCGLAEIRCPFHGFAWNLDGSLKHIPVPGARRGILHRQSLRRRPLRPESPRYFFVASAAWSAAAADARADSQLRRGSATQ
ncbi:MAG: Rieske 2Fe-2S domain-containing protein [Candidatus Binatus sp.]|uniref:aromatic ring-hydroxylating oxygenase subunit alpha n=1 Tax=Candidatus Binatus sp. TaxID=2811406 RepID=UPI00272124CD|nr:Rieske 2Fe-2S domain-containing protein [Candidatus Binatus sp.]MDO8433127.1 Rieske 2Fe-2S domain-containing protein [Candidatus Binatus sp.]